MLKIMIVDDMDIVRREIKRLKLWGDNTDFIISDEASNGHEALEKLEKSTIDLVITDIRMPKVDGIELLKKITEKKLCPCVVLLSDHSEFRYAKQGLVLGAFDYMVKPVTEEELDKVLQRVKDFLLGKRYEQQRIESLEQKLGEKIEVFFPRSEVNQLLAAMKAGDKRAVEYAARIVDIVWKNLNHDLIKTESLLNNIMLDIRNNVLESCKWLDKFIDAREMGAVDYSKADEVDSIKALFASAIDRVITLLERLKYSTQENGIVNPVCKFVIENIDREISLTIVSDSLYMNKSYVSEAFKQKTGISFIEYLTVVKMERAKKLIVDGRLKTYKIAELLCFKDIEYFSKLFKKHTGFSPTEYRQNITWKA
ncbi:MAG: response regulator transcription factor [Clostridia bacterium]